MERGKITLSEEEIDKIYNFFYVVKRRNTFSQENFTLCNLLFTNEESVKAYIREKVERSFKNLIESSQKGNYSFEGNLNIDVDVLSDFYSDVLGEEQKSLVQDLCPALSIIDDSSRSYYIFEKLDSIFNDVISSKFEEEFNIIRVE